MIAVSDTTAITTLVKVGRVDLLEKLFGRLLIPLAVRDELLEYHRTLPSCCELRSVSRCSRLELLLTQADAGEAEAISLAAELRADVLLDALEHRGSYCLSSRAKSELLRQAIE